MSKRLLLIVAATLLLPLAAAADDTTAQPITDPSALGPQASSPAGGSNADAGTLQPGGGSSPLQSSGDSSLGLTAPNSNVLQAPVTSDQALKVLSDEADGTPHTAADSEPNPWLWLIFSLIIAGIIAAGGAIVVRDRRRFQDT